MENDADPKEENHRCIESTPAIPEVSILILVNSANVHFGNHFGRKEKRDEEVSEEGRILERAVAVKSLGRVETNRDQGGQGAEPKGPSNPFLNQKACVFKI